MDHTSKEELVEQLDSLKNADKDDVQLVKQLHGFYTEVVGGPWTEDDIFEIYKKYVDSLSTVVKSLDEREIGEPSDEARVVRHLSRGICLQMFPDGFPQLINRVANSEDAFINAIDEVMIVGYMLYSKYDQRLP